MTAESKPAIPIWGVRYVAIRVKDVEAARAWYADVLGTHRLNLGNGYALHGTNQPTSVGRAVSHGCVRLRNEDIETLFQLVPVGTPVFIY